ncbi:MAG: endonuclease III domain-containing protein [Halobacteriota archaeon]
MRFTMKPPIDLARTMTIQIPALEWIYTSDSYLRTVDCVTQQINRYPLKSSLSSHLDMQGVQPDEMRWSPLFGLRSHDPFIRKLRDFFPGLYFMTGQDPFRCLILTVLTQNKTAERARAAFYTLVRQFGKITPETLSVVNPKDIVPILYRCGPHRKAEYIVSIAREVMRQWEGDLSWVYDSPDLARERLVTLPGVGPKTADCVLLYAGKHEVVPIDTHLERVARRLGFIERGAMRRGIDINANEIRGSDRSKSIAKEVLETELPHPGRSHLLLIQHGFEFCHATGPECFACPIRCECPSIDNRYKSTAP